METIHSLIFKSFYSESFLQPKIFKPQGFLTWFLVPTPHQDLELEAHFQDINNTVHSTQYCAFISGIFLVQLLFLVTNQTSNPNRCHQANCHRKRGKKNYHLLHGMMDMSWTSWHSIVKKTFNPHDFRCWDSFLFDSMSKNKAIKPQW